MSLLRVVGAVFRMKLGVFRIYGRLLLPARLDWFFAIPSLHDYGGHMEDTNYTMFLCLPVDHRITILVIHLQSVSTVVQMLS